VTARGVAPHGGDGLALEVHVPADATDGVRTLVLLHGRRADRTDLFGLRRRFPSSWAIVAPDAPFPAAPWGYGPGRAWYRFMGRDVPEPESFEHSLGAVDALLASLGDVLGVMPGRIALGGFSQGGTVSLAYSLTHSDRELDVLNFSGFLASHSAVRVDASAVRGARIFWGHGTADPSIPFELAVEGRTRLRAAGANLEARDYAIGHSISADELDDAIAWLG
jgi:phospholipase/carboxylesterase